ncbi:hypothetical protein ABPG74_020116 [Tetrahymena malaccensis]
MSLQVFGLILLIHVLSFPYNSSLKKDLFNIQEHHIVEQQQLLQCIIYCQLAQISIESILAMEVEENSDIPEFVAGQIVALRKLNNSTRQTVQLVSSWGYKVIHQSVQRIYAKYQKHLTFTDIQRNERLNFHNLTRQSINNILLGTRLGAYKLALVHFITDRKNGSSLNQS